MPQHPVQSEDRSDARRRSFLGLAASLGLAGTLFPGALAALAGEEAPLTEETIAAAERIAGITFSPEERRDMVKRLNDLRVRYDSMRAIPLNNSLPPAIGFNPLLPGMRVPTGPERSFRLRRHRTVRPSSGEELAFLPLVRLARLVETRAVSSVELTKLYLDRLERHGPSLHCVVNLTPDRALRLAEQADREIAGGKYRGFLHGIPWGVKDLFAVKGYPTTWGSERYQDRVIDEDATVVRRLDAAGAVLAAKLSTGRFASGENWFGGQTRNPWNLQQPSGGSSAGPGAATAAGLVGFSVGTETRGSIASPASGCGVSGLRPTFGRVSRYGAMTLSWTMDKVGPICRTAEDCAAVFDVIRGPDGSDASVIAAPFGWNDTFDVRTLRVGYVPEEFEGAMESAGDRAKVNRDRYRAALDTLRGMGVTLVPVAWPDYPRGLAEFVLSAEGAAAFDYLNVAMEPLAEGHGVPAYRMDRFIPAVEYLQANRLRTRLMRDMAALMEGVDCVATPTFVGPANWITNLTGHPELIIPCGYQDGRVPAAISFVGRLFGEAAILALARAFQGATDFHEKHPKL